jgi:hypothetical protein
MPIIGDLLQNLVSSFTPANQNNNFISPTDVTETIDPETKKPTYINRNGDDVTQQFLSKDNTPMKASTWGQRVLNSQAASIEDKINRDWYLNQAQTYRNALDDVSIGARKIQLAAGMNSDNPFSTPVETSAATGGNANPAALLGAAAYLKSIKGGGADATATNYLTGEDLSAAQNLYNKANITAKVNSNIPALGAARQTASLNSGISQDENTERYFDYMNSVGQPEQRASNTAFDDFNITPTEQQLKVGDLNYQQKAQSRQQALATKELGNQQIAANTQGKQLLNAYYNAGTANDLSNFNLSTALTKAKAEMDPKAKSALQETIINQLIKEQANSRINKNLATNLGNDSQDINQTPNNWDGKTPLPAKLSNGKVLMLIRH